MAYLPPEIFYEILTFLPYTNKLQYCEGMPRPRLNVMAMNHNGEVLRFTLVGYSQLWNIEAFPNPYYGHYYMYVPYSTCNNSVAFTEWLRHHDITSLSYLENKSVSFW